MELEKKILFVETILEVETFIGEHREEDDSPQLYELHQAMTKFLNYTIPGKNYITPIPYQLISAMESNLEEVECQINMIEDV